MKRPSPELWEKLRPLAREMRHMPTNAENVLWEQLRDRRVNGMKFRRQHWVERFIVDFYCAEHRLAIEVDGAAHASRTHEDTIRQEFLESLGMKILRFRNEQVLSNVADVLKRIVSEAGEIATHS